MAPKTARNLLVSWNHNVLAARRAKGPVRLSDVVPGAEEAPLLDADGALCAPPGWVRDGEDAIRSGALEIVSVPDEPVARARGERSRVLGGALLATGALFAAFGLLASVSRGDAEDEERERMALVVRYLAAADERAEAREELAVEAQELAKNDEKESGTGVRAKGEEGSMGASKAPARFGVAGPAAATRTGASSAGAPGADGDRAAALREATEFGMIGLLDTKGDPTPRLGVDGVGEGGGGRGEGIGLGRIGTIGHGAGIGAGSHRAALGSAWGSEIGDAYGAGGLGLTGVGGATPSPGPIAAQQSVNVRAGEWDDNANYREFGRFLATAAGSGFHPIDVRERQFIVARDVAGKPLPSCEVSVLDAQGNATVLRTLATGRAVFFPHAERLSGTSFTAYARCGGNAMSAPFTLADDGVVDLRGKEPRAEEGFSVDIGFALDTTGSMREEIDAVKATLRKVAQSMNGVDVRVGLVEYKDKGDEFVTRVYPMASDVTRFANDVSSLSASGGGDMPEAMSQGFHDALTRLDWRPAATARLLFVIGDAPPHVEDQNGPDYADDARLAARKGVQVHGVAASGMDALGQVVFRQISQYTGGTELFVLRGGAGPQSVGGGDPIASCGGTQEQYRSGNLAELVLGKVTAARHATSADPLAIPGRGKDESSKPCGERLALR